MAATVTPQHVPVLTAGVVGLLVFGIIGISVLNHFGNRS